MSHVVNSFMKTFFFMFGLLVISGQNLAQSINEIEKRANQAFDSKKYNAAKTDFQILFSRDPNPRPIILNLPVVCILQTKRTHPLIILNLPQN